MSVLSYISLWSAVACSLVVAIDVTFVRRPMPIMRLVWPLTMLWAGVVGLALYFTVFRKRPHGHVINAYTIAVATTHCGSGCTLGDLIAESITGFVPLSLLGSTTAATWVLDFVLAFLFGILFQYFSIVPMRNLKPREGIVAALKADALSLIAWQLGMYGWMALALFVFYAPAGLEKTTPVFWFIMQLAMCVGFATSFPVNALLLKSRIKEPM